MSAPADVWLSEMWQPVREVPRDVRAGWAAVAAARNEELRRTQGVDDAVESAEKVAS